MKFYDFRLKLGRAKRAEHLLEIIQSVFKLHQHQSSSKTMSAAPHQSGEGQPPELGDIDPDPERMISMLRNLLASERANGEKRRQNNAVLQKYVQSLKEDQLRLQNDLEQALQFGHKVKAQKQVQIECLETNLKQKDKLIDQLKTQLSNLDETKLRAEFEAATEKLQEHHRLELDQIRKQIDICQQQLSCERADHTKQAQIFQQKLDDQLKMHERELAHLNERLSLSQQDLQRVLNEPQNLMAKALREEKRQLDTQIEELNLSLEENQKKYDSMRRRLEMILAEQERLAKQNQDELERLQQLNGEQRKTVIELKSEIEDKQETIQLMEFNLNRSEKRVENLLNVLKEKEETYRELINKSDSQHGGEIEKLSTKLQAIERRSIGLEHELSVKQNELVAARLDQETRLESLRNDRDELINKLVLEKENLVREVQSIELKLACECSQSQHRLKLVEQIQLEAQQLKEENNRLSMTLNKREAKLEGDQRDLQTAKRDLAELRLLASRSDGELALGQLRSEIEEERAISKRFKANMDSLKRDNDKLHAKLRIAESNLLKTRSAVNREHEKMMREYEKKLESIKSEQLAFDRNRLRYKRYGCKLKKYCEHLRQVHSHLCTPTTCGYFIGSTLMSTNGTIRSRRSSAYVNCDDVGLLDSDGDAQNSDSPYYDEISGDENNDSPPTNPDPPIRRNISNTNSKLSNSPRRFIIKRTGLSSAISSPTIPTNRSDGPSGLQRACLRGPLRPKSTNTMSSSQTCKQSGSRGTDNPFYYYNPKMATKSTSIQIRGPKPAERKISNKVAAPTLCKTSSPKVLKPPILSTEL